jgi:surface antigen
MKSLLVVVSVLCLSACSGDIQGTKSFVPSNPLISLMENDNDSLAVLQTMMETAARDETVTYTGSGGNKVGNITPIRTFQRPDGIYCRDYRETIRYYYNLRVQYGTACRIDGNWAVVGVMQEGEDGRNSKR